MSLVHLIVLGHKQCGVVKEAIKAVATSGGAQGHFASLIEAIRPAISRATGRAGDPIENTVRANVEIGVEQLRLSEPRLADLVNAGALTIVGAIYDPGTHEVELIVT
jgi:carbonic anhydrase